MTKEHEKGTSPFPKQEITCFPNFNLLKLTPENPISPIPVLVAPGFGCDAQSYKLLMEQLNSNGFITISPTYKYGMRGEPKKILFLPDVDKLKQQSILEAIETEGYSNQQGIKQVNVVAHSKGAYDVALAAVKHPKNFRNIIMIAPGGLRPKMNMLNSIRTLKEADNNDKLDKLALVREGGDAAKLVLENNAYAKRYKKDKLRYNLEGFTSATKSMKNILPKLRKNGIKIIIISQIEDPMYPPSSYSAFVRSNVDDFIQVAGIHGEIKYKPQVGQRVSELLLNLERIK